MFEDGQDRGRNDRVFISQREIYDQLLEVKQAVWRGTADIEDVRRDVLDIAKRLDRMNGKMGRLQLFVYGLLAGVVSAFAGLGATGRLF